MDNFWTIVGAVGTVCSVVAIPFGGYLIKLGMKISILEANDARIESQVNRDSAQISVLTTGAADQRERLVRIETLLNQLLERSGGKHEQ